jgi:SH3-like domain-containing protein
MKNYLLLFAAFLAVAVSAQTNEVTKVKVKGDNVNLRTRPTIDAEAIKDAMMMRGEELIYVSQTNNWVEVELPEYLDCWVASKYVQNGLVTPNKLNIRSGPSLNYSVVGVVPRDTKLAVRGEFNDWLKIGPPKGCRAWIFGELVDIIEPPKPEPEPEPVVVVPESQPEPEPEPVVAKKEPEEDLPPLMMVLDKTKKQGTYDEIPGVLRRANPGLYKLVLVTEDFEETICLVRGSERQLERYLNRTLLIKGKKYWIMDTDLPVLSCDVIHLDPIITD